MPVPFRRLTSADYGTFFLWVAAAVLVIVPAGLVFRRVWGMASPIAAGERVGFFERWAGPIALGQTVVWCAVIGCGAAALALVWAWWMRGLTGKARGWAMVIGMTPLLLPSYLAYAGWNLVRSPGTWLGDALALSPPWVSEWAWRGIAAGGLVLWAWPLALLVLAPACGRVPRSVLEALRADGAPWHVRMAEVLRMLRGDVLRAAALVGLVMAGSAIPLHIARVNTYTIWLWSEMNRVPDIRGVWVASLPVLVIALAGAVFVLRLLPRVAADVEQDEPETAAGGSRVARPGLFIAACCVWGAAVVAPFVLFVTSVREPSAFAGFWRDNARAIANGAVVGAGVGVIGAAVLLAAWMMTANRVREERRRGGITGSPVFWLTVGGLVPGVLVGSAYGLVVPLSGTSMVIATHAARFVFIAAIVGLWLGLSEPREQRAMRLVDGAGTLGGWLTACVRPRMGVVMGIGLALGLLSLHEIESTVQVQPPGMDNLAQYLLDQLHYLRQDQLAAAGATMTGIGLAGAVVSGLMLTKGSRRGSE